MAAGLLYVKLHFKDADSRCVLLRRLSPGLELSPNKGRFYGCVRDPVRDDQEASLQARYWCIRLKY